VPFLDRPSRQRLDVLAAVGREDRQRGVGERKSRLQRAVESPQPRDVLGAVEDDRKALD
jgi:hypothetical protein